MGVAAVLTAVSARVCTVERAISIEKRMWCALEECFRVCHRTQVGVRGPASPR